MTKWNKVFGTEWKLSNDNKNNGEENVFIMKETQETACPFCF